MADISYTYTMTRKNFGKQPLFCEVPVHLLDSINPDKAQQNKYCLRNPVHTQSQASTSQKEHYVNTKRIILTNQGVNHAEGGWPKDIPFTDEESTTRYRRRFERDDSYIEAVLNLYPKFDHYIKQNNAIDLYTKYFKGMPPVQPIEKSSVRFNNVYKDQAMREIASISWTFEENPKLVVAYCNKKYPFTGPVNINLSCSVWDIENPNNPTFEFLPPSACWQAVCSPLSPSVIVGGLEDGRVCIFDIREQQEPVMISPIHLAHRDPVSALVYMQSRLNTEFLSGSTDGQCMWWDVRDISAPTDALIMSVRAPPGVPISLATSEGVSALQYERSFPTRFLCGTDTGLIINVNRKGKSFKEMMSAVHYAHHGPVKAIHRSPCSSKIFITCGDWTTHIWSDEIHTSPIITGMPHRHKINDVAWAPQRISSYMSVSTDGKFRFWGLLRKTREPTIILSISKNPLQKIKPHDEGKLIALGDAKGDMYIISLSENLVHPDDKDKQLMVQMFDRENRREYILETRVKEIRLKQTKTTNEEIDTHDEGKNDEAATRTAEEEYRRIVSEELRAAHTGYYCTSSRTDKMRKR